MQNRAIKYRIYPSAEQKVLFAKTFGCCRKIWNLMLADKITYYRQTQKMLQTTPAQYIQSLRITNAKLLLETTNYNVSEISNLVGYENPLYFSRFFKKQCGMSPVQFRKQLLAADAKNSDTT